MQSTTATVISFWIALVLLAVASVAMSAPDQAVPAESATPILGELLRDTERRAGMLEADVILSRKRSQSTEASEAVGRILADRLRSLREIESVGPLASRRSSEVVRATDRRLDLEERRRALVLAGVEADEIVASLPEEERAARGKEWLRQQATGLITAARRTIDELHETDIRYLNQLTSLDAVESQIASNSETLRQVIRRKLLWRHTMSPKLRKPDRVAGRGLRAVRLARAGNPRTAPSP